MSILSAEELPGGGASNNLRVYLPADYLGRLLLEAPHPCQRPAASPEVESLRHQY